MPSWRARHADTSLRCASTLSHDDSSASAWVRKAGGCVSDPPGLGAGGGGCGGARAHQRSSRTCAGAGATAPSVPMALVQVCARCARNQRQGDVGRVPAGGGPGGRRAGGGRRQGAESPHTEKRGPALSLSSHWGPFEARGVGRETAGCLEEFRAVLPCPARPGCSLARKSTRLAGCSPALTPGGSSRGAQAVSCCRLFSSGSGGRGDCRLTASEEGSLLTCVFAHRENPLVRGCQVGRAAWRVLRRPELGAGAQDVDPCRYARPCW